MSVHLTLNITLCSDFVVVQHPFHAENIDTGEHEYEFNGDKKTQPHQRYDFSPMAKQ